METRTMRIFAIRNFAVILAYIVLLCTVTAVSAGEFRSDDKVTKPQTNFDNETMDVTDLSFRKCLICGHSPAGNQTNVTKGDVVDPPNKYPFIVQVTYNDSHLCGGVILDGYHILTAARCFYKNCTHHEHCKITPNETGINLLTSDYDERTKWSTAEKIFIHPNYEYPDIVNDIAIVKLKNPITCNLFASPVCLPFRTKIPARPASLTTTKWKKTDKYPPLMEAGILELNESSCNFRPQEAASMHCAQAKDGIATCFGDSGGPMFFKNKVFYVVGILSLHGTNCDPDAPAKYTDVSQYLTFIKNITGLQSEHEI